MYYQFTVDEIREVRTVKQIVNCEGTSEYAVVFGVFTKLDLDADNTDQFFIRKWYFLHQIHLILKHEDLPTYRCFLMSAAEAFCKHCGKRRYCSFNSIINPFPHMTILQQMTLNIFCRKNRKISIIEWIIYDSKWNTLWQKLKLLVLSNFFFCHYVLKKLSAAEASDSVYMRERVKHVHVYFYL